MLKTLSSLNHVQKLKTSVERKHFSDAYLKFRLQYLPIRCHKTCLILVLGQMRAEMPFLKYKGLIFKWKEPHSILGILYAGYRIIRKRVLKEALFSSPKCILAPEPEQVVFLGRWVCIPRLAPNLLCLFILNLSLPSLHHLFNEDQIALHSLLGLWQRINRSCL